MNHFDYILCSLCIEQNIGVHSLFFFVTFRSVFFSGIGWCMLFVNFMSMCSDMIFKSWSLVYIRDAVSSWTEPEDSLWTKCHETWNTKNCRPPAVARNYKLKGSAGVYASQEYFRLVSVSKTKDINEHLIFRYIIIDCR